jgi:hypothetical protein
MNQPNDILEAIPDPDTIRSLIAQHIRQASELRLLLRVSEARHRPPRRGERGRHDRRQAREANNAD